MPRLNGLPQHTQRAIPSLASRSREMAAARQTRRMPSVLAVSACARQWFAALRSSDWRGVSSSISSCCIFLPHQCRQTALVRTGMTARRHRRSMSLRAAILLPFFRLPPNNRIERPSRIKPLHPSATPRHSRPPAPAPRRAADPARRRCASGSPTWPPGAPRLLLLAGASLPPLRRAAFSLRLLPLRLPAERLRLDRRHGASAERRRGVLHRLHRLGRRHPPRGNPDRR